MKTKTRFIALLLCLLLAAAALTGCGSKQRGEEPASDDTDNAEKYSAEESSDDITVEEQIILDKDGIKITALDYKIKKVIAGGDSKYSEITLLLENESDEDVTIYSDVIVVDGFKNDGALYSEVSAGEKVNIPLDIFLNSYEKECIGTPGKIEVYFLAYDKDNNEIFTDEHTQILTSAYNGENAEVTVSNTELVSKDGLRIGYIGVEEDKMYYGGSAIYFCVENNTGAEVMLTAGNVSVNGTAVDTSPAERILSDNKMILVIFVDDKIDTIEKIELGFAAYDYNTSDEIFTADNITIDVDL